MIMCFPAYRKDVTLPCPLQCADLQDRFVNSVSGFVSLRNTYFYNEPLNGIRATHWNKEILVGLLFYG